MSDAHQHTICPHCGYSLQPDATVSRAGWTLAQSYTFYEGQFIQLSPSKRSLLYSLARAHPRSMSPDALMMRFNEDFDSNTLTTQICQLRKHLRGLGLPVPIRTVAEGYIWSDQGVPQEEYARPHKRQAGVVHGH